MHRDNRYGKEGGQAETGSSHGFRSLSFCWLKKLVAFLSGNQKVDAHWCDILVFRCLNNVQSNPAVHRWPCLTTLGIGHHGNRSQAPSLQDQTPDVHFLVWVLLLPLSKWLYFCHHGCLSQVYTTCQGQSNRLGVNHGKMRLRQCVAEQGMKWPVTEVLTDAQKQWGWCGKAVAVGEAHLRIAMGTAYNTG